MKHLTTLLLTLLMSMGAWGAEISYDQDCTEDILDSPYFGPYWCNAPIWQIDGAIEKGDYKKLKSILKRDLISKLEWISSQKLDFVNNTEYSLSALTMFNNIWRPKISVNSKGGDVLESIQIGRLIRQLRMDVSVYKSPVLPSESIECLSACMNIRIAGINGLASDDFYLFRYGLGVHRPSFDDEYFAGLSSSQAEALYLKYENEVKAYMIEMGASQGLIDLTFNTPSSDIHMLRHPKFDKVTYSSIAWWEERVDANCSSWALEYNKEKRKICATMLQVRDSLSAAKEYLR